MASECVEVYCRAFSFPEIKKEEGKARFDMTIASSCAANFLFYIPIIGTIFAACMLSYALKEEKKLSAENKAFVARCVIALTFVGILLIYADIIGTLLRLSAKKAPAPGLEGRAKRI